VWWGICTLLQIPTESNSEIILKIGQYLVKLWARVRCLVFFDSQCRAIMWHCLHDPMFSCFDTKPACDRQMGSNITTSLTIDYLPLWPFAMKSGMMIAVQPGPLCRCTLAFVCAPLDGPPRNVEFELQSNFVWECLHLNSDMIHRLRWDLILACHIWPRFMKRWVWEPLESKCGQIWGFTPHDDSVYWSR